MPRPDWYTPAMAREDKKLDGAHWRCPRHGTTTEPLLLNVESRLSSSVVPYCVELDCSQELLLVRRATDGPKVPRAEWNRRRPELPA